MKLGFVNPEILDVWIFTSTFNDSCYKYTMLQAVCQMSSLTIWALHLIHRLHRYTSIKPSKLRGIKHCVQRWLKNILTNRTLIWKESLIHNVLLKKTSHMVFLSAAPCHLLSRKPIQQRFQIFKVPDNQPSDYYRKIRWVKTNTKKDSR